LVNVPDVPLRLVGVRLPIAWDGFGLPNPLQAGSTVLSTGDPGWAWDGPPPDLGLAEASSEPGSAADGWDLDHIVLLVPDVEEAVDAIAAAGSPARLRIEVRGRPTAFFRVGPVLEVIQSPVRAAALYGAAMVTTEPLEIVVVRWRSMGHDVTDPRPAIQQGRRIFTVRALEAGLAVMSPTGSVVGSPVPTSGY
jgi:catechol 2,3-dioxygenase-like lactoylglutathione lyase family enzyme